jgi:hypothetical protein
MTDNELILIQERDEIQTITYDQYSVKKLFIPYQNIDAVEIIEDKNNDTLQLKLHIKDNISLSIFFMKENEKAQSFFNELQNRCIVHRRQPEFA